jgi:hypothetical protein
MLLYYKLHYKHNNIINNRSIFFTNKIIKRFKKLQAFLIIL